LRTAPDLLDDLGLGAILPLLRSRTVADVDAALDGWVEPVNNLVIADVTGRVRYRVAGRVPMRDGDEWTGWVHPLPAAEIAPDEVVVTANQRPNHRTDALGQEYAPPFRAAASTNCWRTERSDRMTRPPSSPTLGRPPAPRSSNRWRRCGISALPPDTVSRS
jgi:penicillin amidase